MRGNVVFYVTRQYMKKNRKRTLTAFFGIFFMVMLMTCVFVGKETAFDFLERMAVLDRGKWHVAMYDLKPEEAEKVRGISWVKETARSKQVGMTDFPESGNESRPYLNIKAYETPEFDWMNIQLKEGRLPENERELVVSNAALTDGSSLKVGDQIEAKIFDRTITAKDADVVFPFYSLTVKEGVTVAVPESFSYYGENDSFTENKVYTGEEVLYTIVGIMETPFFEDSYSAGYTGLTLLEAPEEDKVNLALRLNLDEVPDNFYEELREIAGEREIDFNDRALIFSGNSSNSTFNLMVKGAEVFFTILIMAASMVLIANVFQLSFRERSLYLGMLSSVGATGRQKRSSVYYEAGSLLLGALPLGILAGFGVILGGMKLIKPYLLHFMDWGSRVEEIPIELSISPEALAITALFSILTVFLAAFGPAKKVGKIGAIDSIRGNMEKKQGKRKRIRFRRAEELLAKAFVRRQPERSGSIRRAVSVFLVILLVTAFGSSALSEVVEKKVGTGDVVEIRGFSGEETGTVYQNTMVEESRETYEKLVEEIRQNPDTENTQEWYTSFQIGQVDHTVYSQEFWAAYHDIFNQYYHRTLSDEEFQELSIWNYGLGISLLSPEDEVLKEIARAAGIDEKRLTDPEQLGILLIQSGNISTDTLMANEGKPDHYRYYDIQKMTDLEPGDTFEAQFYSITQNKGVDLSLTVAGCLTGEKIAPWLSVEGQFLYGIVSSSTREKIEALMGEQTFDPECHLQLKNTEGELMERLKSLAPGENQEEQQVIFISREQTQLVATMAEAILGMIRVLLVCFVLLTSVICLMNLYNSIRGYFDERRREFAMLLSVGMTKKQLQKELYHEAFLLLGRSLFVGLLLAVVLIRGLQLGLIRIFGYLHFFFPLGWTLAAVLFTGGAVFAMISLRLKKVHGENLLEEIRRDSV